MRLKLEFYTENRHKQVDEIFLLQDLRKDLVLQSNNNNLLELRFYSGKTFHDALDITGATFDLMVKENPTDTDANAAINIHVTDLTCPSEGKANIPIPLLESGYGELVGNYLYEIKMTTAHGIIKTICFGTMSFLQSLFE